MTEHFHGEVVLSVTVFDPATLAEVHERVARLSSGLALEFGVEPGLSIQWPHSHYVEPVDEDEDAQT